MVKHTATIQKLPLGEAGLRSKTEEGCGRQLFHVHSAANTHSVPFRLGFQSLSVQPAALFRPGKPGHLPPREGLGGSLSWIPFSWEYTEQRCASGHLQPPLQGADPHSPLIFYIVTTKNEFGVNK